MREPPHEDNFEKRWFELTDGWVRQLPPLLQGVLLLWTLMGAVLVFVEDLRNAIPGWAVAVTIAPALVYFLIFFLPPILARLPRWLTWPIRKLQGTGRRNGS